MNSFKLNGVVFTKDPFSKRIFEPNSNLFILVRRSKKYKICKIKFICFSHESIANNKIKISPIFYCHDADHTEHDKDSIEKVSCDSSKLKIIKENLEKLG
ncbi:MAG: hypothetical protein LC122_02510 [Chitinophagales bacterium]|nr:hypothetical protein [Chitinophagales bacterium]